MKIFNRMKKQKSQIKDNQEVPVKTRKLKKINGRNLVTIICAVVLVVAHIMILWAIKSSWRYYAIYPALFGSVVGIILCALAIIDIIFFVGFNHKDLFLKIVSTVLAICLMVGGTLGTVYISKANTIVGNVLDDGIGSHRKVRTMLLCGRERKHDNALVLIQGPYLIPGKLFPSFNHKTSSAQTGM